MRRSSDFFKHIGNTIETLTKAYLLFLKELDLLVSKSKAIAGTEEDHYRFLTERLNRAIDTFKSEMEASLGEYYFQADNDMISPYSINHVKDKLDALKKVYRALGKRVPEPILKEALKHNYFFHCNISILTAKKILEYFELNYMLHKRKEEEKK